VRGHCSLAGLLAKDGFTCVHEGAARVLATAAGDMQKQDVVGVCGGKAETSLAGLACACLRAAHERAAAAQVSAGGRASRTMVRYQAQACAAGALCTACASGSAGGSALL